MITGKLAGRPMSPRIFKNYRAVSSEVTWLYHALAVEVAYRWLRAGRRPLVRSSYHR